MRVDVYWNLHKKCWSVRHKGLVLGYASRLVVNDAKFVVQPAGRRRVLETKKKNVHAFVRGEFNEIWLNKNREGLKYIHTQSSPRPFNTTERIRYNPYLFETFVNSKEDPIFSAERVYLSNSGKCFLID
jgi:hypothetical protein